MARQKDVLTTGEVARICNVAPRTVSKWFDSGQLHGYRIPGSKDRRIPLSSLMRFMKQHHIPLDGVVTGKTRVLIVDNEPEVTDILQRALAEQANYDLRVVSSGFAAGLECERFKPHVLLMDVHLPDLDAQLLLRSVRQQEDLTMTRVVGMSSRLTDGQAQHLRTTGFDGFLRKPFNLRQVIESIEDAAALVY
jgi:excisionase family DNA binding protein